MKWLQDFLADIREIVRAHVQCLSAEERDQLVDEALLYLSPRTSEGRKVDAQVVGMVLAVTVLMDEYLMSIVNAPGLKKSLWEELQKDNVTYQIWSDLQNAIKVET